MMYPFFIPDTHSLSSLFFSQTDYSFINLFKELAFGFIKQNLGGGFPFIDFWSAVFFLLLALALIYHSISSFLSLDI